MAVPSPKFEFPNEMRAVAERSVEQAKLAFNNYMRAAEEAVSSVGKRVEASQIGALDISKKAMHFAKHNVLSAFEFAHGVIRAADRVRSVADASPKRAGAGPGARPLARLQQTA